MIRLPLLKQTSNDGTKSNSEAVGVPGLGAAWISAGLILAQLVDMPIMSTSWAGLAFFALPRRYALILGVLCLLAQTLIPLNSLLTPLLLISAAAGIARAGTPKWNELRELDAPARQKQMISAVISAVVAIIAVMLSRELSIRDAALGLRPSYTQLQPGASGARSPYGGAALSVLGTMTLPAGAPLLAAGIMAQRIPASTGEEEMVLRTSYEGRPMSAPVLERGTSAIKDVPSTTVEALKLLKRPKMQRNVVTNASDGMQLELTFRGWLPEPVNESGMRREAQRIVKELKTPAGAMLYIGKDPGVRTIREMMAASATTIIITPKRGLPSLEAAMRSGGLYEDGQYVMGCEGELCPKKSLKLSGRPKP